MKVHPTIAIVVAALTAIAIATKFWAGGEALKYGGPTQMLSDPHGHVYIQIQNQLLEHNAEGEFVRRHDLGELGVDPLVGAAAFFSNGDILLRRGEDRRSRWNRIAAYQRRGNTSDLEPESPGAGLARCNLQTRQCTAFADPPVDFKSTIGVTIDTRNDEVYISDTTRHTLRKYTANGIELGEPMGGFKFPNQLLFHDEQLLVADTNHHQIRVVEPRTGLFGKTLRSIDVVPADAQRVGLRWPSHFARIGDNWWVNNMNTHMQDGGVYLFNDDWQYQRRIPLPEHADPISILPFASGALISDWYNDRVYRVSEMGSLLKDFASPGLEAVLAESREKRTFYRALSWMGFVLLAAVFIGLITKAILSPAPKNVRAPADGAARGECFSAELVWFEPDPEVVRSIRRSLKFGGAALLTLVALTVYGVASFGSAQVAAEIAALVAGLILVFAVIYWITRSTLGTAIGFEGGDVILQNHNGVKSRHPTSAVMYNETAIATPDMAVLLGKRNMRLYDKATVAEQILPRLRDAEFIPQVKMQRLLFGLQRPQGTVFLLVIAGLAAVAATYLIR
ncbi:MAG: hypothetical protein OER22_02440 [Gammaproteobacteria bacterium]|nr:hypothetical protein [Gammaproteobacteria bacterium]MDH3372411.1 hypothetical protein [Gammaproteobacteria bacterium]MDH3409551.1 hypothetical protein [Gammaproteobacteria bacterium]MDH3551454.1 hypothetical protein [Gammaproteobacteria bacterium]